MHWRSLSQGCPIFIVPGHLTKINKNSITLNCELSARDSLLFAMPLFQQLLDSLFREKNELGNNGDNLWRKKNSVRKLAKGFFSLGRSVFVFFYVFFLCE